MFTSSARPQDGTIADGQLTLQLHQQWQAARASAHIKCSLVLPPDSDIVAPVSIRSPSGIQNLRKAMVSWWVALWFMHRNGPPECY